MNKSAKHQRRKPIEEDEFVWFRLFFGDLAPEAWYEVARYLQETAGRLHFHVLSPGEEEPENTWAAQRCARRYDKALLHKFGQYILDNGGKFYFSPQATTAALLPRLMMLCRNKVEYRTLRKELHGRFPGIAPRSGQLAGLIYTGNGHFLGVVS